VGLDPAAAANPATTVFWAQLFHFYQPPTQTHEILHKVAEESYRPLLEVLWQHPHARVAVNINAVLTEQLHHHGLGDIIGLLRRLGDRGQVEFLGSGRYHPILPLIPDSERRRQVAENHAVNRRLIGPAWQPGGFFPPEMCYSAEILPAIATSGHRWIALSGVACPAPWPTDVVYRAVGGGASLPVLFRDDGRSNRISFKETSAEHFVHDLLGAAPSPGPCYVFTAMDAETFGHHIQGWETAFLARLYGAIASGKGEAGSIAMVTPGEVVDLFPAGPPVEPHPSSWSTTAADLHAGDPYPLWRASGNRLHELQWEHTAHAIALANRASTFATSEEGRRLSTRACELLGPALHSCQYWWASRRPMWDASMVYRGLALQAELVVCATRAILLDAPEDESRQAVARFEAASAARSAIERLILGLG
jgi:alpha-amylase/alpha-mannosidase (GH57 family)